MRAAPRARQALSHGSHAPRPRLGGPRSAPRRRGGRARPPSQAACLRDDQEAPGPQGPPAPPRHRDARGQRPLARRPRRRRLVLGLVGAGFLRGGSAQETRFALGPVKLFKTDVKTFDEPEFAIRFNYPKAFNAVDVRIGSSAGARPAAQKAIGLSKTDNVVIVTRYNLQRRVTEDNLDTIKPEADKLFSRLAGKDLKAKVTTVAGMPALEYEAFDLQRPKGARSRLLVLFDGVTEYLINCQSMPDQRAQLEKGCDVVRDSLEHV
jgi:hypothetical protein